MIYVGHTRFSLFQPGSGAWNVSNGTRFKSADEYREHLYSDERLKVRARIFFDMTLPQLARSATGFNVKHIVSYSDSLPTLYREKLEAAAGKYDFLVLDECSATKSPLWPADFMKQLWFAGAEITYASYRLDDDDILPSDYFEQVESYATRANAGMMVSLGAGVTALYIEGALYNVRHYYQPMMASGLLSVCHLSGDGSTIDPVVISHNESDRANPVILDSRRPGFLWVRHGDQDTAVNPRSSREQTLERVRAHMSGHPPVSELSELQESFSELVALLHAESRPGMHAQYLLEGAKTITAEGLRFPLDPASGKVRVTAKIEGGAGVESRSVLVSFVLTDMEGITLDPQKWMPQLGAIGISTSESARASFFRYITSRPGVCDTTFEFELPEGVVLREVRLVKWRPGDFTVTAIAFEVEAACA